MGGASRAVWRGVTVDPDTAAYLTAVAAEVTRMTRAAGVPDFTVTPIPGCGSYQTTTAASAGTHAGGGAVDINCEGLTDAQARVLESAARKWGGAAWFRPRTSPTGYMYGWQRHVHILRSDCGDLASAARTQVGQYRRGLNGLANNGPDTGDRSWVDVTWGAVKALATTINTIGGTVADKAQTPPEDDMPYSPDQIYAVVWKSDKFPAPVLGTNGGDTWTPENVVKILYQMVDQRTSALTAQVAALTAVVQSLAGAQGADPTQIAGIVDKAVRDRLAQVKFDVTDAPA